MNEIDVFILRKPDTDRIFRWLKACASASIVGISGIGKSNLFNQLLDPKIQNNYLEDFDKDTIIVRVNLHYLSDHTLRSLFSLILEQLEITQWNEVFGKNISDEINNLHDKLLDAGNDLLKIQRYFKLALRLFFQSPQRKIVLLFDQFDELYAQAESHVFSNLRGLRETFKYRLAFCVFTRLPLEKIAENDAGREEFVELIYPNMLWLKPYNQNDTNHLLRKIAKQYDFDISSRERELIYQLAGGHAGLSRAILIQAINSGISLDQMNFEDLQKIPSINHECMKIWESLDVDKKRTMILYSSENYISHPIEAQGEQELRNIGVLNEENNFFSPVFRAYVHSQEQPWDQSIYLDPATRRVWIFGKITPRLTALEMRIFETLYHSCGSVVDRYELIYSGWPKDDPGGVSDEALNVAVSRIRRKIELDPNNPQFLITHRDQGYQLINTDT